MDETRAAPLLPLGSLLEDEDAVFTVLPDFLSLSSPCWAWQLSRGREVDFSKAVEVQEMHPFFRAYPSPVECF